jgi:hypothetical protein
MKSFEILHVLFNVVRTNDHYNFKTLVELKNVQGKMEAIEIHYGVWECHPLGSPIFGEWPLEFE